MNTAVFINSNLSVRMDGFYNIINNLIAIQGFTGESFKGIPVDYVTRRVNEGFANTYGGTVLLDWRYQYGSLFNLNAHIAYSLVNGKIDDDNLIYAAKHGIKSGFTFNILDFSISPRLIYRSKSQHQTVAGYETIFSDPFAYINLSANYKIKKQGKHQIILFTKIENLTNAKYYNISLAGAEGFGKTPQDPIRINFGLVLNTK